MMGDWELWNMLAELEKAKWKVAHEIREANVKDDRIIALREAWKNLDAAITSLYGIYRYLPEEDNA